MYWRKLEENLFKVLMKISTVVIISSLLFILITMLVKGLPSLSWEMISKTPEGGFYLGRGGGILNAIMGSIYLGLGATLIALLITIPVVIYINIYAPSSSFFVWCVRTCMDMMYGIPSIVYGAFGFIMMAWLGLKVSLLAGIFTVSLLIMPIIMRAMDEVIKTIPKELFDAAYSLGATKWETAIKVILRKAFPGIITASLLGFGRAIGDAAAVMFTCGFTDNIPDSVLQPAATLPLAIFYQLSSPIPEVRSRAYAAALVLTIIILLLSLIIRLISGKYSKHSI